MMLDSILDFGYAFCVVAIAYLVNSWIEKKYIPEQKRIIVAVVGVIIAGLFLSIDYQLGREVEWRPIFITFWVTTGFYGIFLKPLLARMDSAATRD